MADDNARIERLILALENATNAFNRLAQGFERKGRKADTSIKRRARPELSAGNGSASDAVRIQVDRAIKRIGR